MAGPRFQVVNVNTGYRNECLKHRELRVAHEMKHFRNEVGSSPLIEVLLGDEADQLFSRGSLSGSSSEGA